MMLGARARSRRQQDLARRMLVEDRPKDILEGDGKQVGVTWIPEPVAEVAQKIATAGGFAPNVEAKLERAGLPLSAGEFLALTVGAAIAGGILGQLFLQNLLFALVIAAVGAFVPNVMLDVAIARRTARLHSQLADVVSLLASSLRAGHSFFQALDIVSKEIGEPAGPEFQRVMVEVRLGRSVQDALDAMAERVGSEDFKWAVLAVNIQREVGGNLAEILDIVAETVRERDTIRRQVKVLTAEGRLSVKILVALPFVVGLYCWKVNPDYMNLLFSTRLGWIFLGTGAALMALGIFWARKVVKIDV
jgi:tight adherence protein B